MSEPHKHEGREVARIYWPDTAENEIRCLSSDNGTQLRFHSEYLGDHSENWILEICGGVEVRRHNTRFIETIIWIED